MNSVEANTACRFDVVTLFPGMFAAIREYGISSRAFEKGLVEMTLTDPRTFSKNAYRSVDDRPYGGGPGMVMRTAPLVDALNSIQQGRLASGRKLGRVVYLSPQGQPLTDAVVKAYRDQGGAVLIAGRYEGIDERFINRYVDHEISIGDYVLSGGELPAMILMDAVIRQLPGALGDAQSALEESFADALLDHPHFTRSEEREEDDNQTEGERVPSVLLSGHHADIERWRLMQRLGKTWLRRPELLEQRFLSADEKRLLSEFRKALKQGYGLGSEQIVSANDG